MSLSLPLVLVIVVVAVVVGVVLGRRRGGDHRLDDATGGVRVIRPPAPAPTGLRGGEPGGLADAINRATEAAHVDVRVTPEMLAKATVTSNVSVSTDEGTLDPAQARAIMDAVSRAMAGQAGPDATLAPAVEAEVRALVARGRMVDAVKRVRQATGLDLRHAKDMVDAMR